ncbi:MAG: hypothetical protein VB015_04555 [Erysipelotrichaceae bacterium]|nr:hypothetical protein [Erysipelotrichaceae bacterium]
MDAINIAYMIFIIIAVALALAALILRILRKRLAAKILSLIASIFLVAYSVQFCFVFNSPFTSIQIGYFGLFVFSIILTIYELTSLISKR